MSWVLGNNTINILGVYGIQIDQPIVPSQTIPSSLLNSTIPQQQQQPQTPSNSNNLVAIIVPSIVIPVVIIVLVVFLIFKFNIITKIREKYNKPIQVE